MTFLIPDQEINYMRDTRKTVTQTLVEMKKVVKLGSSRIELDKITEKYRKMISAIPIFKDKGAFFWWGSAFVHKADLPTASSLKKKENGYNFNIKVNGLKNGRNHGCGIVRGYVGHGIGRKMHEDPQVPNFGSSGRAPRLKSGMTLAIEPMINLGTHEVKTLNDEWTVSTKDRKPSAPFWHRNP